MHELPTAVAALDRGIGEGLHIGWQLYASLDRRVVADAAGGGGAAALVPGSAGYSPFVSPWDERLARIVGAGQPPVSQPPRAERPRDGQMAR